MTPQGPLVLGIDVGTTTVKAALFTLRGELVAVWSRPTTTHRPGPGLVEQDPHDWTLCVKEALATLTAGRTAGAVLALGLTSQVNTDVFVGADGAPLAPAITWQDGRAAAAAAALDASITPGEKAGWWGAPMPVGASHVLARMVWMGAARPDVWARTTAVLSPKDFCLLHLCGAAVADPVAAFGVVGADGAYLGPLLARVPGAAARLAPLHHPTAVVGTVRLGEGEGVPVVAGTMDAFASLFGCGIAGPGQGTLISGTSEVLALVGAARVGAAGIVTFAPFNGLVVNAGPTQAGGDSLRWWARATGGEPEDVLARAQAADPASRVLFLPQLQGERAPLWDAALRGAFVGLDGRTGAPELARAVLEGVALSARHVLGPLAAAAGFAPDRLFTGGGGARSDLWSQIRADCLGLPLHRTRVPEVGCLGAAILAAVGAGAYASLPEAVVAMTRTARVFEPDRAEGQRYEALFARYRAAIDALRPLG